MFQNLKPSSLLRVTAAADRLPKKASLYAGKVGSFVKQEHGYITLQFNGLNGDQAAYQEHELALVVGSFDVFAHSSEGDFTVGRYPAESAEVAKQLGAEDFRLALKHGDPMLLKQKWSFTVKEVS